MPRLHAVTLARAVIELLRLATSAVDEAVGTSTQPTQEAAAELVFWFLALVVQAAQA